MNYFSDRFLLISCILFFYSSPLWSCAPVTHAYLSNLWLDKHKIESSEDRKAFMLGSLFPDIRYLGKVKRFQTHKKSVTLKKIEQTEDYFEKGMLFHAYVDEYHDRFTNQSQAYQKLPSSITESRGIFIELVLDEILFNSEWLEPVIVDLRTLMDSEKRLGLSEIDLYSWHMMLTLYFSKQASENLKLLSFLKQDILFLSADAVKTWSVQLPLVKEEPYYQSYASDLIEYFKKQINN